MLGLSNNYQLPGYRAIHLRRPKKIGTSIHMNRTPSTPCGHPHEVNLKCTSLSSNGTFFEVVNKNKRKCLMYISKECNGKSLELNTEMFKKQWLIKEKIQCLKKFPHRMSQSTR